MPQKRQFNVLDLPHAGGPGKIELVLRASFLLIYFEIVTKTEKHVSGHHLTMVAAKTVVFKAQVCSIPRKVFVKKT